MSRTLKVVLWSIFAITVAFFLIFTVIAILNYMQVPRAAYHAFETFL